MLLTLALFFVRCACLFFPMINSAGMMRKRDFRTTHEFLLNFTYQFPSVSINADAHQGDRSSSFYLTFTRRSSYIPRSIRRARVGSTSPPRDYANGPTSRERRLPVVGATSYTIIFALISDKFLLFCYPRRAAAAELQFPFLPSLCIAPMSTFSSFFD